MMLVSRIGGQGPSHREMQRLISVFHYFGSLTASETLFFLKEAAAWRPGVTLDCVFKAHSCSVSRADAAACLHLLMEARLDCFVPSARNTAAGARRLASEDGAEFRYVYSHTSARRSIADHQKPKDRICGSLSGCPNLQLRIPSYCYHPHVRRRARRQACCAHCSTPKVQNNRTAA